MAKFSYKSFTKQVRDELVNLRDKGPKSKIARLRISNVRVNDPNNCIYGRLYGSFDVDKAVKINPKRYRFSYRMTIPEYSPYILANPGNQIQGSYYRAGSIETNPDRPNMTALEVMLYGLDKQGIGVIINFLQNKRSTIPWKKIFPEGKLLIPKGI